MQYILYLVRTVSVFKLFVFFLNPSKSGWNIFQIFEGVNYKKPKVNIKVKHKNVKNIKTVKHKNEPVIGQNHLAI